ncbi:MAG TPA: GNAT family N-acetyltransferase [Acholeplasmataceae bacterium]|jgi:ribosomal protein S18 acetylase RimI-like enzyme|nr:GNAT family N-acetyltransferase [Acholeplasmataceae bacterium]
MITIYERGKDFLSANQAILFANEIEYGMAIHNAKILFDRELDESSYAIRVDDGGGVLLAIRSATYPLVLVGNPAGISGLVSAIDANGLVFSEILGTAEITSAFIATYEKSHPVVFKLAMAMDIMVFNGEGRLCANAKPCSAADLETMGRFAMGFNQECFGTEIAPEAALKTAEQLLARAFGYYHEGKLVAIVNVGRETDHYATIRFAYTDPAYRGRGFMQALVTHACRLIQDEGKTPTLNVDVANSISNHVYRKIGFVPCLDAYHYRMEYI